MDLKEIFYDWGGANQALFSAINVLNHPVYDQVMIGISRAADRHYFPVYLFAIVLIGLAQWSMVKAKHKGGGKQILAQWYGVLTVLIVGFVAMLVSIGLCKNYFSFPRPYEVFDVTRIRLLGAPEVGQAYKSFPSGHVAFVTLMVIGLWPVISGFWAWLGVAFITLVCWSRIALGMHFPADVLGAFLIMWVVTSVVRVICYNFLRRLGLSL